MQAARTARCVTDVSTVAAAVNSRALAVWVTCLKRYVGLKLAGLMPLMLQRLSS